MMSSILPITASKAASAADELEEKGQDSLACFQTWHTQRDDTTRHIMDITKCSLLGKGKVFLVHFNHLHHVLPTPQQTWKRRSGPQGGGLLQGVITSHQKQQRSWQDSSSYLLAYVLTLATLTFCIAEALHLIFASVCGYFRPQSTAYMQMMMT